MSRRQTRRSISISGAVYRLLADHAASTGVAKSKLVEGWIVERLQAPKGETPSTLPTPRQHKIRVVDIGPTRTRWECSCGAGSETSRLTARSSAKSHERAAVKHGEAVDVTFEPYQPIVVVESVAEEAPTMQEHKPEVSAAPLIAPTIHRMESPLRLSHEKFRPRPDVAKPTPWAKATNGFKRQARDPFDLGGVNS